MNDVVDWLTRYPLWIVVVLAIAAFVLYVAKLLAEHVAERRAEWTAAHQFRVDGRTSFETRVLTDRYKIFKDLFARLVRIMTDLDRVHAGMPPHEEPFLVRMGNRNEIVPLTAVLEDLEMHRLVLGDEIYNQFSEAADLLRRMANAGPAESGRLASRWSEVRGRLRELAETEFGLSQIRWHPE